MSLFLLLYVTDILKNTEGTANPIIERHSAYVAAPMLDRLDEREHGSFLAVPIFSMTIRYHTIGTVWS